jgi:hypothetical protein
MVQSLEGRVLLAADLKVAPGRAVLSDVRGGAAGLPYTITLRNKGNAPLTFPAAAFSMLGKHRKQFVSFDDPSGTTLQPGQSTTVRLAMKARTDAPLNEILTASFRIVSNDPDSPNTNVSVRGVAMRTANGGTDEPSLKRIMELFQIDVDPGDPNANTPAIDNVNNSPDEIYSPRFVKAGSKPVYVDVLGSFAPAEAGAKGSIGYYKSGQPSTLDEIFEINTSDNQTLNPRTNGSRDFDPGSGPFSFYMEETFFDDKPLSGNDGTGARIVYGEDAFNTWESRPEYKRKVRAYPFVDGGTVVPNAYVLAFEEYGQEYPDHQDVVLIAYNVKPASGAGSFLGMIDTDDDGDDNRVVFSKFQNNYPSGTAVNARTSNIVRLVNTGNRDMTVTSAVLGGANASSFSLATPISSPITIARGASRDFTVNFTATSGTLHTATLTFNTDSRAGAVQTVNLSGLWQSYPEYVPGNQTVSVEPTLQEIVDAFGYKTATAYSGQTVTTNGLRSAIGDEVLSDYWQRADSFKPVFVKQLAAYRSRGTDSRVMWIREGQQDDANSVFLASRLENQTVTPKILNSTKYAQGSFTPTTDKFAFRIDEEYTVDSFNTPQNFVVEQGQHRIRMYPLRDENAAYVPDAWIMVVDYTGFNYDYNDGVYLVRNVKPAGKPASPHALQGFNENGDARLNWAAVSGATGYRVYRSAKSNTGFGSITSSLLTSTTFLDTTATTGKTWYYRVVAVNGAGEGVANSTSVVL